MKWLILPLLAPLVVLGMTCGGGDSGDSEAEVSKTANNIILTYFDVLSGKKKAQALLDIYAPECRQGVDLSAIEGVVALVNVFAPELTKSKIEEVDLGKLNIVRVGDEIRVTPVDPDGIRFKVGGKFVKADEYLTSLGGQSSGATVSSVPGEEPVTLVRRDGKLYIGDCSELKDLGT